MAVFELTHGGEAVVTAEDLSVYYGVDGVLRAAFRTDGQGSPLPHCDPAQHGYALTMLCFVDMTECVAIAEVVDVERLLSA